MININDSSYYYYYYNKIIIFKIVRVEEKKKTQHKNESEQFASAKSETSAEKQKTRSDYLSTILSIKSSSSSLS